MNGTKSSIDRERTSIQHKKRHLCTGVFCIAREQNKSHDRMRWGGDRTYTTVTHPVARADQHADSTALSEQSANEDAQYIRAIILMLECRNAEGQLEAMHQVVALTRTHDLCREKYEEDNHA